MAQNQTYDQAVDSLSKLQGDELKTALGKLNPDALVAVRMKLEGFDKKQPGQEKQGTYKMTLNGTDFIPVPYGRVLDAWKAGYKINDEDQLTFAKDKNEETMKQRREHPMNGSHFAPAPGGAPPPMGSQLPQATDIPESVSGDQHVMPAAQFWESLRQNISDLGQPKEGQHARNFLRRFGADLFGMADFPIQATSALADTLSDNPNISGPAMDQLEHMLPVAQVADRIKEFKDEWKTTPVEAVTNVPADAAALLVAHKLGKLGSKAAGIAAGGDAVRRTVRSQLGIPELNEHLIKKFGEDSEAARTDLKAARQNVVKDNVEDVRKHNEAKQEVEEKNKAVVREEKNRVATNEKLEKSSKELDDKIDAAQKKAKAADDKAWKVWRNKVANVQVAMDPVVAAIKAQTDKMNPNDVALFKDILRETRPAEDDLSEIDRTRNSIAKNQGFTKPYADLPPNLKATIDEVMRRIGLEEATDEATGGGGAAGNSGMKQVPASRLHGWKTQLEDVVRDPRAGNIKFAIGQVLDSVRKLEEDVSKQAGADKELAKARALHGPYVDTFRNPQTTPTTAANYVRSKVTPNFTKDMKLEAYLTRLGSYDSSIPKLATHIDNLSEGAKKLPDKGPLRDRLQTAKPSPTAMGVGTEHPVAAAANIPSNPLPEEPVPGAQPPFGKTKAVGEPPDPNEVYRKQYEALRDALKKYGHIGPWVLRLGFGATAEAALHGDPSKFASTLVFGQGALILLTKILRGKGALEWLARPSAEEMEMVKKLPPKDAARLGQALKALSDEEIRQDPKKASLKIAPAVATALGLGGVQQQTLDQVKKQAQDLQQPPPGGQSSLKVTHIFDPTTGSIRAA